jgi:hypothetical protein
LRFAPSAIQPIGIPKRSVRMDHFHPSFARSVGFLPVPSPPAGGFMERAVDSDFGEVEPDHLVVAGDRLVRDSVEEPCRDPLVTPVGSRS